MHSGTQLRQFGRVFDGVAVEYDAIRSGYPVSLVEMVAARGGLDDGSRVLEVGCGTGKLTELLAARGLEIDAVDPGPEMIAVARKRVGTLGRVRFHTARFEDVALPVDRFDAVLSATAFHWVEPEIGWRKSALHLRPSGLMALLSHTTVRNDETAAADDGFLALIRKHAPEIASTVPPALGLDTLMAGAEARRHNASEVWDWIMGPGRFNMTVEVAAHLFDNVEVTTAVRGVEQTADEQIALFRTTSLYFQIEPSRREVFEEDARSLVESLGGTIRYSLATVLMTARRTEEPAR
jgi:cyclopropane fatty-acyl-phospholipid synthase-like methyltransferase